MRDESPLDYHKRIIYGKLIDKTLNDVDYTELSELVYGQPYSSDVARRMFYGSRRTLELLESEGVKNLSGLDIMEEIDGKMLELQKERQKFRDQRRERDKLISADARQEHLYATLSEAAFGLTETIGDMFGYCDFSKKASRSESDNEALLVFSDWHYGMVSDNIFNTYNKEICKDRVKCLVQKAINRLSAHRCRKLHIMVLGDLFHGAIHTSARVASEELVCDQMMEVSEILAQAILKLSMYVDETVIHMTYGNHARTVQNKNDSLHRDNMERIIPWWLEQRICALEHQIGEDLNITLAPASETEFLLVNICGHDICGTHGDLDSVRTSPKLISTLYHKKYGRNIEHIILGDKHHSESFEELGVSATICGSLCGADDYANEKRLYSTPSQLLLIINEEDGVDAEYKLKLK